MNQIGDNLGRAIHQKESDDEFGAIADGCIGRRSTGDREMGRLHPRGWLLLLATGVETSTANDSALCSAIMLMMESDCMVTPYLSAVHAGCDDASVLPSITFQRHLVSLHVTHVNYASTTAHG